MNKKRFYVSTPIYYPNNKLHLGHAYTTILSDVMARYKKLQGYEVFFITGSDEHGQKIEKQAKINKQDPKEFVSIMSNHFKNLWKLLNINYNKFVHTSSIEHSEVVQKIFTKLQNQKDIYLDKYAGWYCISCEEFVTSSQMTNDKKHLLCKNDLKYLQESSYFFQVSKYQKQLLDFYKKNPNFIYPSNRITEMINNFLKPGLQDLSVTRTSFDWGIHLKDDTKHVIYVWIDALSNYLSGLGYLTENDENFKKFWNKETEILQFCGKEITRFHAIYWPILLMALKLRLPNKLISHSWITSNEEKMSKSKGNIIDPFLLIEEYGSDAIRFFLTFNLHISKDNNYNEELLLESYNANLVNNLGNLLSRTMTMIEKYFANVICNYELAKHHLDRELENNIKSIIKNYTNNMDQYFINEAIQQVINLLNQANKYIQERKPWELFANNDKTLNKVINNLVQVLKVSAFLLQPILVENSQKIFQQLNINFKKLNFTNLTNFKDLDNLIINKKEILFKRIKK